MTNEAFELGRELLVGGYQDEDAETMIAELETIAQNDSDKAQVAAQELGEVDGSDCPW